jgi:glycosyltransferase involved in cell wall biosynthesis
MSFLKIALLTTDKREHDRDYQNTCPSFGTAPSALLEGFSSLPDLEVHVLSCTQQAMSSPAKLADNIWFHSLHVPKIGWLRTGYAGCLLAVRKKLLEIRPDIVHAQGTERDCATSALFTRIPKVLTVHGNLRAIANLHHYPPFSFWWIQARLEAFCLPRFDGVICISKYTQQQVSDLAKKTWLLPNATEKLFFEPRPTVIDPSAPPLVLVVANVDSRKNQNTLIQALDPLARKLKFSVKFYGRCGKDPYGKEFRSLLETRPWCSWGGMIDRENLRDEFARAIALFLPTREDNCPMVVLEAQASGVPVIASNVGGVPDLVENGVTGLLTNPDLPSTMPIALEKILTDKALAVRLAEGARKQALACYHPNVIATRHVEIYREVLSASKLS